MKDKKQTDDNPAWDNIWDQGTYQTGSTQPPRKRGGMVGFLLGLVIFLCGIVSAMGLFNINPLEKAQETATEPPGPVTFHAQGNVDAVPQPSVEVSPEPHDSRINGDSPSLTIKPSPQSVPNVPQEGGLSYQEIYQKNIQSVVSISATLPNGKATGTGVILSSNGFIVTNCHVVSDAQSVSVLLSDDRILDATIVGTDPISDLAVLSIEAKDLIPAEFGDSDALQVGDAAVAIGDPLGLELRGTMTNGIISAIQRNLTTHGRTMTLIQTNAALNSGNSGGPLINCYGQVVGINTMKVGDYMSEGLGFAIPSTTVKDVVEQLLHQGYVSGRPTLGIKGEFLSSFYRLYYDLPQGLHITDVDPASDAYLKGVRSNDILVSIDGQRITGPDEFESILYSHKVGDSVSILLFRAGRQYSVEVLLQEATG